MTKMRGWAISGPLQWSLRRPAAFALLPLRRPRARGPAPISSMRFFTVSINSFLTRSECDRFLDDRPRGLLSGENIPKEPVKKIGGGNFQGSRIGFAGLGHQFSGVYYHGFLQGSCYELGYGLATAGYGAVDGMKHVDDKEVFSILEKTLETVAIRLLAAGAAANSPSIHAFAITPNCFGDLTILKVTGMSTERTVFSCDLLYPLKSVKGSCDLQFKNMAGQELKEAVRLFVACGPGPSASTTHPASRMNSSDCPQVPL
jgi:hypothetical protein